MTEEVPFIRITNREVYDKLSSLEKAVFSMDQRMNSILEENVGLHKRVRSLELKFYGILAGIVGGAALFFANVANTGGTS